MLIHIDKDSNLSVKTIDDIVRCTSLSSLLEVAGWPKPGNVHRTRDYPNTRFEHFLAAIAAIQPNFNNFCIRIKKILKIYEKKYSYIKLGRFFKDSAETMIEWQKGGNVILGHILILAPLVATTVLCLNLNKVRLCDFKNILKKIINDTTVQDTIDLYESIRISNVGGLGKIEKYDINDKNAINQLQNDKITLKKIFEFSQTNDTISKEYASGFNIIINEGLPYFIDTVNKTNNINIATVNTFLFILSKYPDTLIIKKSNYNNANLVSIKAKEILDYDGLMSSKGKQLIENLDDYLYKENGKLNPGATADLIVGVLFCALIFGLRF
ncbi:MAG: triphosphoribosyl-dephospho-CoA synthase [Candidatus Lokiarchaeota archaeon]|nr:triphosphoribosyl-dephospho-CoA synthase [Candidatus Lokiarchaeota archaeon]